MSTKRPDVLVRPPSPMWALTLAEMHVAGWRVVACCSRCAIKLKISLPAMIRTYGPDDILWGKKPRCPGAECDGGELLYSACSIRGGSWVLLSQSPGALDVEAYKRRRPNFRDPR